jgi:transcriptional regulator with XRE-family HTH domain
MPKIFGQLIKELRVAKGLSVYALAKLTGLSDQAIHDLEASERHPSLDTARRLASALEVNLDWVNDQLPPIDMPEATPGRPRGRPPKAAQESLAVQPRPSKGEPRGRPRKEK